MPEVENIKQFGMHGAHVLANLSEKAQFDLIAEGLPVLMQSASSLFKASGELTNHPRSAAILKGHASEEVAKILILIDLVRCPSSLRPSRVGEMIKLFYQHRARLIYIEAQTWRPTNVSDLQEIIDNSRKSHYLEGEYGEYIMPNSEVHRREEAMYADIFRDEDGTTHWSDPESRYFNREPFLFGERSEPTSWHICKALQAFGAFDRKGLELVSEAWGKIEFCDDKNYRDAENQTSEMLCALQSAGLFSESATQKQVDDLYCEWQLPMYLVDFELIKVSLETLQEERDRKFWDECEY